MDGKNVIYADGACSRNPGPGGWGFCIISEGIKTDSGFEQETTNNRMELTAVIESLMTFKTPQNIDIYTDSQYVTNAFNKGWLKRWSKNNWKTRTGNVKNIDLWKKLLKLSNKHNIKWHWVKGHAGNKYNELVDKLATDEIKNNKEIT